MTPIRLPAALLAAAVLLCSACGAAKDDAGETATSSPSSEPASELIVYTDKPDESAGVTVESVADIPKLEGAPDDFKQFVAGLVDASTTMLVDKECPFSVSVAKIDPNGFALGSMFACGGAAYIWAKRDGVWQEIWGGQEAPDCADMKKYSVPKSIVGDTCLDAEKQGQVEYTG
jgi:hypothetical protein